MTPLTRWMSLLVATTLSAACGGDDSDGVGAGAGGDLLSSADATDACSAMCDVEAMCTWNTDGDCVEDCVRLARAARGDYVVQWTSCVAGLTCEAGELGAPCPGGAASCGSGLCVEHSIGGGFTTPVCSESCETSGGSCPVGFDCRYDSDTSGDVCVPDRSTCEPELPLLPVADEWLMQCRGRLAEMR